MNTKKIFYLFILSLSMIACAEEDLNTDGLNTIDLIDSNDFEFFVKHVILYENDDYLIKTNFETYINSYPFGVLHNYENIEMQVREAAKHSDILSITDYLRLDSDSIYTLAHHLERGTCLIFDKEKEVVIPEIKMENYIASPPYSSGRRFYINGDLFIETVDVIFF